MKHCSVEIDLARHLAEEDESESRQEYQEQIGRELIAPGGECYPFDLLNVDEALGFINIAPAVIAMQANDAKKAGELLMTAIRGYWEMESDSRAAKQVANECLHSSKNDDYPF